VPAGASFSGTAEIWFEPTRAILDPTPTGAPPQRLGDFPIKVPSR
jgi:hypothetical protein